MKFAIITDSFPPLRNSGAIQIRDLSLEFVRQGHKVVVITPSSEINNPFTIEDVNNVQVVRLKSLKTKDISYIRRVIAECIMPFAMIFNLKRSCVTVNEFDGVITYAPSIFLGLVAKKIKRYSKCKNYLIIRDIFPQWAVDVGVIRRNGAPYYFFKLVEKYLYSTANIIGVQTPANLPYFRKETLDDVTTVEVLQNWLSKQECNENYSSIVINDTKLNGRSIFVYAGNMGDAQGLDIFIDLAERVSNNNSIGFLFVGRGRAVKQLKADVEKKSLNNILFYDEINSNEIPALYEQCSFGIISLDRRHKTHNIPGKFLSYLNSGLPILAVVNKNNDMEGIINENKIGCVTTNHSVDVLVKLVNELMENSLNDDSMKDRCRELSKGLFSTEVAVKQIVNVLV